MSSRVVERFAHRVKGDVYAARENVNAARGKPGEFTHAARTPRLRQDDDACHDRRIRAPEMPGVSVFGSVTMSRAPVPANRRTSASFPELTRCFRTCRSFENVAMVWRFGDEARNPRSPAPSGDVMALVGPRRPRAAVSLPRSFSGCEAATVALAARSRDSGRRVCCCSTSRCRILDAKLRVHMRHEYPRPAAPPVDHDDLLHARHEEGCGLRSDRSDEPR